MSLATTIGAGTLIGGVAAFAVYAAAAPSDQAPASVKVPASFAPVPTPTVTRTSDDCVSPAVLRGDECVVVEPGPTVVVTDPAPADPASSQQGDDQGEDATDDHGDDQGEEQGDDHGDEQGEDEQGEDEQESEDHESDEHSGSDDHDSEDPGSDQGSEPEDD